MNFERTLRIFICILVVITLVALVPNFMFDNRLNIMSYPGFIKADDTDKGGNSTGYVLEDQNDLVFECQLIAGDAWPYCEYDFQLTEDYTQGVNIAGYDHLEIELDMFYQGKPLAQYPVRIYLKHYDPQLPMGEKIKVNQVEYDSYHYSDGVNIPTRYFQVAEWWRKMSRADVMQSYTDISNVVSITISTPSEAPLGDYRFELKRMTFVGPFVAEKSLFFMLLTMWVGGSILFLLYSLLNSVKHSKVLESKNQLILASSKIDPLTQALNRAAIAPMVQELEQGGGPYSILFLDIDHFKAINDNYGHFVGDQVLTRFSQIIGQLLNDNQQLVRWGGEEFLIICQQMSHSEILVFCNQLQQQLATYSWPHKQVLTCSGGIALHNNTRSFEQMVEVADQCMYQAKQNGRNRFETEADNHCEV